MDNGLPAVDGGRNVILVQRHPGAINLLPIERIIRMRAIRVTAGPRLRARIGVGPQRQDLGAILAFAALNRQRIISCPLERRRPVGSLWGDLASGARLYETTPGIPPRQVLPIPAEISETEIMRPRWALLRSQDGDRWRGKSFPADH